MTSHGIARTVRNRTEEQRLQELDKIKKYRDLETQLRTEISQNSRYTPEVFQLTSKLLRLNPEYYTIWNDRRRLLTSGLLSGRSAGSSPSTASPSSSRTATATTSSADSSSSSWTTTQRGHEHQTAGRTGTTASAGGGDPSSGRRVDDGSGGSGEASLETTDSGREEAEAKENDLQVLKSELAFTIPLLLEFPKCYWIWNYRLWVLRQSIERLDLAVARRVWEEELGLASKMLTKDRRNFHAWGYRRHLVEQLESDELAGESMAAAEFEYTTRMIRVDLSNFSAWHHRSKLIPRLLDERGAGSVARKDFFDSELKLIKDALNVGPEDQSLWYYHQFLMLNLFDARAGSSSSSSSSSSSYSSSSLSSSSSGTITPELSRVERAAYVSQEIDDIKDLLEDYDDIKWLYEALVEYTLALCLLERRQPAGGEMADLKAWLGKLRDLDPMRNGRWKDVEAAHGLG